MLQHADLFKGNFDNSSWCKPIPRSMLAIVNILLSGINIQTNELVFQQSLPMSQLICFNAQSSKPT